MKASSGSGECPSVKVVFSFVIVVGVITFDWREFAARSSATPNERAPHGHSRLAELAHPKCTDSIASQCTMPRWADDLGDEKLREGACVLPKLRETGRVCTVF